MENHINPFAMNINAFRFIQEGIEIFCAFNLFILQVHDMKQTVVGWITIRKESIVSHHETPLPNIYSRINPGDIQHIRILQMNLAVFI